MINYICTLTLRQNLSEQHKYSVSFSAKNLHIYIFLLEIKNTNKKERIKNIGRGAKIAKIALKATTIFIWH